MPVTNPTWPSTLWTPEVWLADSPEEARGCIPVMPPVRWPTTAPTTDRKLESRDSCSLLFPPRLNPIRNGPAVVAEQAVARAADVAAPVERAGPAVLEEPADVAAPEELEQPVAPAEREAPAELQAALPEVPAQDAAQVAQE